MSQRMLTASCVAVALLGVLVFKLINDTDVFWQIRLGQITLEEGRIPHFDRFTYTHAGAPAPPIGWLAQTLFASLYGLGGWRLTRAVHQFALVGSLLVAAATCRRDLTSSLSVAVAMAIAFLVILSNGDLRPQSFGLLCFAILLALARGPRPLRVKLVVAAPLLVVWQNMHPSVVLGVVALSALGRGRSCWTEERSEQPLQFGRSGSSRTGFAVRDAAGLPDSRNLTRQSTNQP